MAGNVIGLHRFADDVGPEPLSLLDTNYDAITQTINSLNTYTNFYVDTGTTNAYTITTPSTQTVSYSDGLTLLVRLATTNTGPATLNVNNLGPQPIERSAHGALQPSDLLAGQTAEFVYDASANAFVVPTLGGGGGGGGSGFIQGPATVGPGPSNATGVMLSVNGAANNSAMKVYGATETQAGDWVAEFHSSTATGGYQNGVLISAATGRDSALTVTNAAGGPPMFNIFGDGSGSLGPYPNQLVWNSAGNFSLTGTATLPGGGSGGVSYLSQLLDVSLTSPVNAQVLTWNGTTSRWVNQALPTPPPPGSTTLAGLTDVALASPASGQFLSYNGTKWVNVPAPSGGGGTGSPFTAPFYVNDSSAGHIFTVNPVAGSSLAHFGPGSGTTGATTLELDGGLNQDVLHVYGANNTTAGHWLAAFQTGTTAAGMSNGVFIQAGTNASDIAFMAEPVAGGIQWFIIRGDGSGTLGASANNMTWGPNGFTFTSTNPAVPPLTLVAPPSTTPGNWLWRIGGPGASGSSPGCSNALVVSGGTNASDYAMLVQNDGSTSTYMSIKGDGSGALGPAPNQLVWSATGAFTLTGTATLPGGGGPSSSLTAPVTITPGTGVSLAITGSANVNVMNVTRGTANTSAGSWLAAFQSSGTPTAGMANGLSIQAGTNATDSGLLVAPAVGGINFMNVRGDGLTVHRYAPVTVTNVWKLQIGGGASGDAVNCSNGIYVGAGTTANDVSLWVQNDTGNSDYLKINGDGSGAIGPSPNQMVWTAAGVFSMTGTATAPHALLTASPDIAINNLQDGQTLVWHAASDMWINATPSGGGGATALSGLSDVSLPALTDGQVLVYNATNSRWQTSANTNISFSGSMTGGNFIGTGYFNGLTVNAGFTTTIHSLTNITGYTTLSAGMTVSADSTNGFTVNQESGSTALTVPSSGSVAITAVPDQTALEVTSAGNTAAGKWVAQFLNPNSATAQSNGVYIRAGSTTNDMALQVDDASQSASLFRVDGAGNLWANRLSAYGGGTAMMWNNATGLIFVASSSARFKTDVQSLRRNRVRETVAKLRAVSFRAREDTQEYYGLIAEEVAAVDPRLVEVDKEGKPFSVAYDRVAMLLLPLVQELMGMEEPA